MTRSNEPRRVAIVAAAAAEILDIAGPAEVFSEANTLSHSPAYRIELISAGEDLHVHTSSGIVLTATTTFAALQMPIDTLLVAGGTREGVGATARNAKLLEWLRDVAPSVRRIGSVCTGAFVLAAAGLLSGRRATTHWSMCAELQQKYPQTTVDPDPIFVCDRGVYTSAGVTAGMDLALALVEEDYGARMAARIARELVLYLRRPGGQPQLSAALALQIAARHAIRDLQSWIAEHLTADLSVSALARRAGMSRRNFTRVFSAETGSTPARFVEQIRIEAARRRLEESEEPVKQVAAQCGFRSADSMRRSFQRLLKRNPETLRSSRPKSSPQRP